MKINRMPFFSILFSMLIALPAFAAEGVPGATISNDSAKPAYGAAREACKADPEKCKAAMHARREACKADPEKCRQEQQARAADHFRKTDADGNGSLSRAEAEKGMPRLVRHFDMIDANKDGQLSPDELSAARKARQSARTQAKS